MHGIKQISYAIFQSVNESVSEYLILFSGLLNSASSMTNLTTESEVSLQRTLSASELCDASYGGHRSRNKQQRTKDLRHSIADSRSEYYNFRRPQSVSLGSQLPAFPTTLHSASSASALGTISENEATCGSTPYIEFTHDSDGESIFGDPPDTPIFNYNPISSVAKVNRQSRGSPPPTQERIYASLSLQPQVESSGHEQLSRTRSNGYVNVPTTTAPIHASEPITQEFVPLYLNPLTGQMYSHNQDYFRPISSPNEVITKPPKPVRDPVHNSSTIATVVSRMK